MILKMRFHVLLNNLNTIKTTARKIWEAKFFENHPEIVNDSILQMVRIKGLTF